VNAGRRKGVPRLELISIKGGPTDAEQRAILDALERHVEAEHTAATPSVWLRAARAQGRRLGMFDYRDRFTHEDVWRLSIRFPAGGREYPGLPGRADAR
jgi:hypothetical protein